MKIKNLLIVVVLSMLIFACSNDSSDPFDAIAQEKIDDTLLIDYLKANYLVEADGTIDSISNGEASLYSKIKTLDVTKNDINYKLYYIILNEGAGKQASKFDSVMVDFSGIKLDSTYFNYPVLESRFDLTSLLYNGGAAGFAYATSLLKGGTKIVNADESFSFENSGEGIFFLPSGLGYGNTNAYTSGFPANTPMIFKIKLHYVKEADNDNDGRTNREEDTDNDGNLLNDDTDGDGIPNYLDKDN